MNIKEILSTKEYDFLSKNEHLKDNIILLCVSGSYAYGTNNDNSDLDIRGIALNTFSDLIGTTTFEQFIDNKTDTVIYSLNKFIKLAISCNPNIIEMLFCKDEDYIYVSPLGKILLDNRHLFLSQKAKYTFSGYARAQLNKLENALSRRENDKILRKKHITRSVKNAAMSFINRYNINENDFKINLDKDDNEIYDIYVDICMKHLKVGSLKEMNDQLNNVINDYKDEINARNKKKDDEHLNKHMMHLVRLYLSGIEILKDNTLHTYREEKDFLLSIRNGYFRNDDGSVKDEFYDYLNKLEYELEEAYKNTKLPKSANIKEIDDIITKIYQIKFKDYFNKC